MMLMMMLKTINMYQCIIMTFNDN